MKIHVLFAQRKGTYEGEYAPEVLDAMDEYSFEENAQHLEEKLDESVNGGEFESVKIIEIDVCGKSISNILTPKQNSICGKVVSGR